MIDVQIEANLITYDLEVLGGTPVYAGTRVPVESLFDYLEGGDPLDTFLDDFPTVKKSQAIAVLAASVRVLLAQTVPAN